MNRALLDLVYLSLRGRILRRARLLRQPRHLIVFLAGLGYFALVFLRPLLRDRPQTMAADWLAEPLPRAMAQLVLALVLATLLTLLWLFASSRPALTLSEAEAHLLLPAPLSRRQVLQYALLKQQPGLLFGAFVLTVFSGSGPPLARVPRFLVLWALLTLVDLHWKGVSLWKAGWRQMAPGRAALARGLGLAAVVGWWTAAAVASAGAWHTAAAGGTAGPSGGVEVALERGLAAVRAGWLDELLAPFLWLAAPVLGSSAGSRLAGVLLLAGLLAVNYEWVLRSRVRFEEAAVERARRQLARHLRRLRFEELTPRVRRLAPFPLALSGRPEMAVYWKNLMLRARTPRLRALGLGAAGLALLPAAFAGLLALELVPAGVLACLFVIMGFVLLFGAPVGAGILFRNDLRADLLEIEVLRAWPLPGWRLVAAEVLASATSAILCALAGAGLVGAAAAGAALAALAGTEGDANLILLPQGLAAGAPLGLALFLALGSLVLVGAPVALVSSAIQNLAALALPGWVSLGADRRKGAAAFGQGMLTGIAHLFALSVGALPAALGVGTVLALLHGLLDVPFTAWELPLLAVVAGTAFLAEAWLLVRLGGLLWDRLDPSRELLDGPREAGE